MKKLNKKYQSGGTPAGTGSLMYDKVTARLLKARGGAVSVTGYKADSPDKDNAYNVIPSNNISMINVPHPVIGTDDTGVTKMMIPGMNYLFPGNYVTEVPVGKGKLQAGGAINLPGNN